MKHCVIDCSFFLSSLLPNEKNHDFNYSNFTIFVPSIFFLECLNVLKNSLKSNRISQESYNECIDIFKDLPFQIDNFSSTTESIPIISNLCQNHGLTSYDASYLELSLRLKSSIGTLDKQLIQACQSKNIQVF